jgi:hypothetical protein
MPDVGSGSFFRSNQSMFAQLDDLALPPPEFNPDVYYEPTLFDGLLVMFG